jgi:hypothetical protein
MAPRDPELPVPLAWRLQELLELEALPPASVSGCSTSAAPVLLSGAVRQQQQLESIERAARIMSVFSFLCIVESPFVV